jgi:hypothetical protein
VPVAEASGFIQAPAIIFIGNVTPDPTAQPAEFILLQKKTDRAAA